MPIPPKTRCTVYDSKASIYYGRVVDVAVAYGMGVTFPTVIDAVAGDANDNQGILGSLFAAILNFLMVGTVMFFVIKTYGRFRDVKAEEMTNDLLKSIRYELREQNKQ